MAARRGRGQRDLVKERHWRRIVRRWRSSGLSVREFCDWQSLSEASFYGWRRELAKRDREAVAAVATPGGATVSGNTKRTSSGLEPLPSFVPVHVVAEEVSDADGRPCRTDVIEVHLPGSVRLVVPAGCDRALLRDVIACCGEAAQEKVSC
jgi:hypothetical protein